VPPWTVAMAASRSCCIPADRDFSSDKSYCAPWRRATGLARRWRGLAGLNPYHTSQRGRRARTACPSAKRRRTRADFVAKDWRSPGPACAPANRSMRRSLRNYSFARFGLQHFARGRRTKKTTLTAKDW
jgi:hypothetical protein